MGLHQIYETPHGKLRRGKNNVRNHSPKQIEQIISSIRRFGWTYPILIDELGNILCGVGRWLAAKKMGLAKVPVIKLEHLNDAEKRALIIADNKIGANSTWDRQVLATELHELAVLLPEIDLGIEITGFSAPEIDALFGDLIDPEADPPDNFDAPAEHAVSQRGDLWILGKHRLACGDAGLETDVRTLMSGASAAMVFADPPYNVRISATVGRGRTRHREFAEASGEMSSAEFETFLGNFMRLAARYSDDGSIHFVAMDWRHLIEILHAGQGVYGALKNLIVWNKTNAGQGSFYRSQHELILVFKNGEAPHQNNIELGKHGRNRTNVWQYAGASAFRAGGLDDLAVHPTVKPVALVADAIRDCTRRGDIVLDSFIGSGTTILAAERVGRRAYGLEIDPLYVDVAVRRWQQFTGRDAILEASGQTFDQIAAERFIVSEGSDI